MGQVSPWEIQGKYRDTWEFPIKEYCNAAQHLNKKEVDLK
jgi:hypothetical protein